MRRRIAIAVGGIAVVVIAVILLCGGNVPLIDGGPNGPDDFSFQLEKVQATPITRTPPPELHDVAQEAGAGVKETMDQLYFAAFVDQGSWGDYGPAFELFEGSAAARAEVGRRGAHARTDRRRRLRLDRCARAARSRSRCSPTTRTRRCRRSPTWSSRRPSEGADGGTSTQVVSVGSYFLRQVDGTWRIFAYDVDRDDVEAEAPSPSGSPS